MSDGYNITKDDTTSIVVKFRNSPVGVPAVPQVELAGYIGHLNSQLEKEAYLQWRVPCLGLTIVGKF